MDPIFFLIASVVITIVVSAVCSLMEASLYAAPLSYVKSLDDKGLRSGRILLKFKEDMGKPISAILILNTISNTGGAAIAGWAASRVFNQTWVVVFSILLVLAILYISEIFPKTLGVTYCKKIIRFIALPLSFLVYFLSPLVVLTEYFLEVLILMIKALKFLKKRSFLLHHLELKLVVSSILRDRLLLMY